MANDRGKSGEPREEFQEGATKAKASPSSATDDRGLEGSILEDEGRTAAGSKSTGAGAEATEGMHAGDGRSQHDKSGITSKATGRAGSGESERTGSEPLDRTKEHKGSYGGEGGEPRTSSDQRESHGQGGS